MPGIKTNMDLSRNLTSFISNAFIASNQTVQSDSLEYYNEFTNSCTQYGVWNKLTEVCPMMGDNFSGGLIKGKYNYSPNLFYAGFTLDNYHEKGISGGFSNNKLIGNRNNLFLVGYAPYNNTGLFMATFVTTPDYGAIGPMIANEGTNVNTNARLWIAMQDSTRLRFFNANDDAYLNLSASGYNGSPITANGKNCGFIGYSCISGSGFLSFNQTGLYKDFNINPAPTLLSGANSFTGYYFFNPQNKSTAAYSGTLNFGIIGKDVSRFDAQKISEAVYTFNNRLGRDIII